MRRVILLLFILLMWTLPAAAQEWVEVETLGRGKIDAAVWLPDGRLALVGARGMWVYPELSPVAEPSLIETDWIRSAVISGDVLVTGHQDGSLTLWDAQALNQIANFSAFDSPIRLLALNADGTRAAVGGAHRVVVWDLTTQTALHDERMGEDISDVALSPDGRWLYVLDSASFAQTNDMGNPSQLDIIEVENPQNRQRYEELHNDYVEHISSSPDGRWLALSGAQGLAVWDTEKQAIVQADLPFATLALFTDQELLAYGERSFARTAIGDWTGGDFLNLAEVFLASQAAFAEPWLALVGQYEDIVRLWNAESGEFFDLVFEDEVLHLRLNGDLIELERGYPTVAVSPNDRFEADWDGRSHQYVLRDMNAGVETVLPLELKEVSSRTTVIQALFSPGSNWLAAIIVPDQRLGVWSVNDGALIKTFRAERLYDMAWSDTYFGASTPQGVILWSLDDWKIVDRIAPQEAYSELYNVRLLLGKDRVMVWDNPYPAETGGECIGCGLPSRGFILYTADLNADTLQKLLETDQYTALDVALSPDETYLAVAGTDGKVHFIDVATGTELSLLPIGQGAVNTVLFDGQGRLITGCASGLAQIWEFKP